MQGKNRASRGSGIYIQLGPQDMGAAEMAVVSLLRRVVAGLLQFRNRDFRATPVPL
jgi:hypothetical protein